MKFRLLATLLLALSSVFANAQTYPQQLIDDFAPPSGPVGSAISVTGSGFIGTTAVWVGSGHDAGFVVNSDTSLSVTVPADATTGQIAIFNPAHSAFSGSNFTLTTAAASPTITSISPSSGSPGTAVTISGTGFSSATGVKFHGTVASIISKSATTIQTSVPADATSGTVKVVTPSGTATSATSFTVSAYPQPLIDSFSPTIGAPGSQITVIGSGFTGANAVWVGSGHDATFKVISDTSMTITVPTDATTGQIAIFNPVHAAFAGSNYTVTTSSVPSVTAFSPTMGSPGTKVTITGNGFTTATLVKFGGVSAFFSVINANSILATVPASAVSGVISVTSPSGTGSSSASFTVTAYPQQMINDFTPASGAFGSTITVTGSGFTGTNAVWVGSGHGATFSTVNDTTLSVVIPSDATTGQIAVFNPAHSAFSGSNFTVTGGGPTITGISPTSGPVGTSVMITGTALSGTSQVKFNDVAATSFSVASATSVTATVPASATTGPITITTSSGTAQSASTFAVTVAPNTPTITSVVPTNGTVGTGITITGTNLSVPYSVTFGDITSTDFTDIFPDGTQFTVRVPSVSQGSMPITVRTSSASGPTVTASATFTASATQAKPTISSISPSSGAPGTVVNVTGTNLLGAAVATFNGTPAAIPTSVTATSLQIVVPTGSNNGVIAVSTPGGTAFSSNFTVTGSSNTALTVGNYTVVNGQIKNPVGTVVTVRGINVFGFNGPSLVPQYLWAMNWQDQIKQIKGLGFNTVRLAVVPETFYSTASVAAGDVSGSLNPDLVGKTPVQVLDLWMQYADSLGLYVVIDMHSSSKKSQYQTWYNTNPSDYGASGCCTTYNASAYTATNWINDLVAIAVRYKSLPHFMGIDIFNEPNGVARWNAGDPNMTNSANYWQPAAQNAANAILASTANPNLLIFVQGVGPNSDGVESDVPMNWGEDFQPHAYSPLNFTAASTASKLVLAPHTYGAETFMKDSFLASNFPNNLPENWNILFGQFYPANAIVPGEWGGHYGQNDSGSSETPDPRGSVWMKAFVNWMISEGNHSSFFWCYAPNSGDTSGIMTSDPFTFVAGGVRTDKMDLLLHLWNGTPVP
jgi:aryl-phospho-beta-D-glucosidase BglC (GH1 family)